MLSSTALLLVLPALVAGHPLQQRATAESVVSENEYATSAVPSGTDTPVAGEEITASPTPTSEGYTGLATTDLFVQASITEAAEATSAVETDMALVTGSGSDAATYNVDGALATPSASSTYDQSGTASPTSPGLEAPSGTASCEPDSWNPTGVASIKLSDVHLQWGPPENPTVKNVYGSADWFNFPFWCQETEFTIFAFPNGTSSSDMGDIATSIGQKTCKLTGISQHGDVPVVRLDISNQEPFVQATDLSGTMDMTINAECGPIRPRLGTELPSPGETSAESAIETASSTTAEDASSTVSSSETGSGISESDTSPMGEGTSISTVSGIETGSMTPKSALKSKTAPTGLETESTQTMPSATLPTSESTTADSTTAGEETGGASATSAVGEFPVGEYPEKSAENGVETDAAATTPTASCTDTYASPTAYAPDLEGESPTSPTGPSSTGAESAVETDAPVSTAIFVEDGMTVTVIGGQTIAAPTPVIPTGAAGESTTGITVEGQVSDSSATSTPTESGAMESGVAESSVVTGASTTWQVLGTPSTPA